MDTKKLLQGKTAIVTGGSNGIGTSVVEKFVEHGGNVAFTYKSAKEKAYAIAERLTGKSAQVKCYSLEASNLDACNQFVTRVRKDFGNIDLLVNNAGIVADNLLLRMREEEFDQVINTNLKSVFNMSKALQTTFVRQRHGVMIHISSIVGIRGNAGQSNYAASKAGIIGFSKSMALELAARGIRSNVVAPGFIETEMTKKISADKITDWTSNIPLKRAGKPSEVADACLFLASEMSSYITGQVLVVDGGLLT